MPLNSGGGYSEIEVYNKPWLPAVLAGACGAAGERCPADPAAFFAPGVTPLAALNVALGAATFTGDPDFPIEPTCDLSARDCARPLRVARHSHRLGPPDGWHVSPRWQP